MKAPRVGRRSGRLCGRRASPRHAPAPEAGGRPEGAHPRGDLPSGDAIAPALRKGGLLTLAGRYSIGRMNELERNYQEGFVARLAAREKQIQQHYRPVISV